MKVCVKRVGHAFHSNPYKLSLPYTIPIQWDRIVLIQFSTQISTKTFQISNQSFTLLFVFGPSSPPPLKCIIANIFASDKQKKQIKYANIIGPAYTSFQIHSFLSSGQKYYSSVPWRI